VAAISNFLFRHLTFLLLFPFYNPDTINLHVLMVLSIGGITKAMLLPEILFFNSYPSMQYFNHKSARGVKCQGKFLLDC
jgi:hypothetical protein